MLARRIATRKRLYRRYKVALTELLISEWKLEFIVVCQILPRKRPPFEEYNDRVRQINTLVSEALLHIKRAKFWRHRGLIDPSADIYFADGIHLNESGNRTLYKSYKNLAGQQGSWNNCGRSIALGHS